MTGVVAALVALVLVAIPAHALDVVLAPYMAALSRGTVGAVSGRVYEQRRRPQGPDQPLTGTAVVVMPRSEALWRSLEDFKRQARESADAYREAAPKMRHATNAYERDLWVEGAADLVRPTVVDAEGSFRIDGVPAGQWLLIATHTTLVETSSPRVSPKERQQYRAMPRVKGYDAVRLWVREVTVAGGSVETFDLTDRNVWFSGVVEHRVMDTGR